MASLTDTCEAGVQEVFIQETVVLLWVIILYFSLINKTVNFVEKKMIKLEVVVVLHPYVCFVVIFILYGVILSVFVTILKVNTQWSRHRA